MRWLVAIFFTLSIATPSASQEQRPENDPRGAVLCAWGLNVSALAWEEICHPNEHSEYGAFLNETQMKIDRFIEENSSTSEDDLNKTMREMLDRAHKNLNEYLKTPESSVNSLCTRSWSARFFEPQRKMDLVAARKRLEDLLSVPRKPVMNPCL